MKRSILAVATLCLLACTEAQTSYKIEEVPNSQCALGEGPHWDIETRSLYFVNIVSAEILRYHPETNATYRAVIEGEKFASFIIPVQGEKGKFAVGCGHRVAIVAWDGKSSTAKVERYAYEVELGAEYAENRFNDAKADKTGRLLAGTMSDLSDHLGGLYSFTLNKPAKTLLRGTGISNGLAWNDKTKKLYFIDTTSRNITQFDYDYSSGAISNPKVIWQHPTISPDGMTIDADGNLYFATYGAYSIYKLNPNTKQILLQVKLPAEQVTSAAFGGPNLDILFVTTSATGDKPLPSGRTFQVTGLGVKGLPMNKVKI